jgi:hypothetical protein
LDEEQGVESECLSYFGLVILDAGQDAQVQAVARSLQQPQRNTGLRITTCSQLWRVDLGWSARKANECCIDEYSE